MASKIKMRLIHWLTGRFIQILCRLEVTGQEHVPESGPCLVIFNHVSNFDVPLLYAAMPRADVVGLMAASYRASWWIRTLVEAQGSLWLRRGQSDRETLERARAALAAGRVVGMSPEGGRSPGGRMRKAKPGAASLALGADVPILPLGIAGSEQLHRSWRRLHRPTVTLRFGPLIRPPALEANSRKAQRQAATTAMMMALAELLPHRYRGVYEISGARDGSPFTGMPS